MKSDMAHGFVEFDMCAKLPMSMMNFSPCLLCMEVGSLLALAFMVYKIMWKWFKCLSNNPMCLQCALWTLKFDFKLIYIYIYTFIFFSNFYMSNFMGKILGVELYLNFKVVELEHEHECDDLAWNPETSPWGSTPKPTLHNQQRLCDNYLAPPSTCWLCHICLNACCLMKLVLYVLEFCQISVYFFLP